MHGVRICRFDSTLDIPRKQRTYEVIKVRVLEVGRFSVFEATGDRLNAGLFTRLCRDPEIETFDMGYPWTGVRLKVRHPEG